MWNGMVYWNPGSCYVKHDFAVWGLPQKHINEHTNWHLTDFLIKPYKLRFFTLFATRNWRILLLAHLAAGLGGSSSISSITFPLAAQKKKMWHSIRR